LEKNTKNNSTQRARKYRENMKNDGFVSITPEHKFVMENLCKYMHVSQASLISYLLDCAVDGVLPKIDEPL
jgi:hypothetical protein